jgi:hypothetical protein
VRLEIDGKDAKLPLARRIASVEMTDNSAGTADECSVVFDWREGGDPPAAGTEFGLWLGYEPAPMFRGKFRVAGWSLEGPVARLTVRAASADLTTEIRAHKIRSHHATTVGAIAKKIAGEHGLKAVVDPTIASRVIEHIDQQGESDVAFLARLARRQGGSFSIKAGRLIIAANGSANLPDGTAKPVVTLKPRDVSHWTINSADRGSFDGAAATYMDRASGKRKTAHAGKDGTLHRDRRLYGSQAEAEAAAAANLGNLTRGTRTGDFSGPGNTVLFAQGLIELNGFGATADGRYLAKTVTHTFDGSGYSTSVEFEAVGG